MKKIALIGLMLAGFFTVQTTHAAEIQNFQVIRNGNQLILTWDPLSSSDFDGNVGYAVTWGDFQSQVLKDKYAKQYLTNVTNLSIRGTDFRRNTIYYFRVFTFKEDNRTKTLTNASKILKWKETGYGTYDTDLLTANDPVIVQPTTDSSGNSIAWDFGGVRVIALDNFADVSWSAHTKMARSDYDGFRIEVASDAGFSNILGKLDTERGKMRARILGLTPSRDYFVRGSFHKDNESFGTGDVKSFRTIASVPRDGSTVASRNLLKIERRKYLELDVGDGSSSSSTSSSSTSSTSTSSSSTSSTSSTSTTSSSSSSSSISARIREIEAQISSLNAELIRLKAQLRRTTGTSSRVSSSTRSATSTRTVAPPSRASGGTSIRERLAARLARLRNK